MELALGEVKQFSDKLKNLKDMHGELILRNKESCSNNKFEINNVIASQKNF